MHTQKQTTLFQFFSAKTPRSDEISTDTRKRTRSCEEEDMCNSPVVGRSTAGLSSPSSAGARRSGSDAFSIMCDSSHTPNIHTDSTIVNEDRVLLHHSSDEDMDIADLLGIPLLVPETECGDCPAASLEEAPRGCWLRSCSPSTDRDLLSTPLAQVMEAPAAKKERKLAQTFLDLGQSTLRLGSTCPLCGMLYTGQEEDVKLHRKLCAALQQKQTNSEGLSTKEKKTGGRQDAAPHYSTDAVKTLMEAHRRLGRACKTGRKGCDLIHNDGKVPCLARDAYVLHCGVPAVVHAPGVVQVIESLGFYDAVLEAVDYTVVVMVSTELNQIMCAVAGRPSTREQDPQLVVRPRDHGTGAQCFTRKSFTFCDVNYVWTAPLTDVVQNSRLSWGSTTAGCLTTSSESAHRRFFASRAEREKDDADDAQRARQDLAAALRTSLSILGNQVVYGHALDPVTQISFAADVFNEERSGAPLTEQFLQECLSPNLSDAGDTALFIHRPEGEGMTTDEDSLLAADNDLSVVSYGD